jgi:L-ascorbate metabolism protein UlaG (beta-lactamase superfamily)
MHRVMLLIVSFLICGMPVQWSIAGTSQDQIDGVLKKMKWTGNAGFMISADNKTIYIDPVNIPTNKPADIVFITHAHSDHFSMGDLLKIATKKTVFVTSKNVKYSVELYLTPPKRVVVSMAPETRQEIKGIAVESTWAYDKTGQGHLKELEDVGFIITIDGVRVFHVGGTGAIPEMKNYKADIVLVPIGGGYEIDDCVKIAEYTGASVVIPMHYNPLDGTDDVDKIEILRKKIGTAARVIVLDYRK